jgi:hypothetical protein
MSVSGRGTLSATSTHPFHPGRLAASECCGRDRDCLASGASSAKSLGMERVRDCGDGMAVLEVRYIWEAGTGAGLRECLTGTGVVVTCGVECGVDAAGGAGDKAATAGEEGMTGEEGGGEVGAGERVVSGRGTETDVDAT